MPRPKSSLQLWNRNTETGDEHYYISGETKAELESAATNLNYVGENWVAVIYKVVYHEELVLTKEKENV